MSRRLLPRVLPPKASLVLLCATIKRRVNRQALQPTAALRPSLMRPSLMR